MPNGSSDRSGISSTPPVGASGSGDTTRSRALRMCRRDSTSTSRLNAGVGDGRELGPVGVLPRGTAQGPANELAAERGPVGADEDGGPLPRPRLGAGTRVRQDRGLYPAHRLSLPTS